LAFPGNDELFLLVTIHMRRPFTHLISILIALFCVVILFSCRRNLPRCRSNCYTINIIGRIYDKTSNTPSGGKPVEVYFAENGYLRFSSINVASTVSNSHGRFSVTAEIDTSIFLKYRLVVSTPTDSNYLYPPFSYGTGLTVAASFYSFNPIAFQNINFQLYPKTKLTVRLHRTQNDSWQYFLIDHHFKPLINWNGATTVFQMGLSGFMVNGSQNSVDSVLTFNSVADTFSMIKWQKKTNGIILQEFVDSFVCSRNGPNIYDIYY
jgi:hypothetical protein